MTQGFGRTRELFEAALAQAPAERDPWLVQACGDDAELLAQVRGLLRADADDSAAGRLLDGGAAPFVGAALLAESDVAGRRVAGFTLVRLLGAGGMGAVYEAEQDQPRRPVALKLLRCSLAAPGARRRFAYEAEVLGQLRHPHIAQVHGAGTHLDGAQETPWIAMELVEGARTLDQWLAQARPDLTTRLRLLTQVCAAVHHGHLKGFVHRDLKPANVLVDRDDQPKVIDFGIARAVDTGLGLTEDGAGQLLGTLAYMSPEQLDGAAADVDVRADVYALGAVLFELVTGQPPVALAGLNLPAAVAAARAARVPAPSQHTTDRLPLGLDWIVLRATARDKEQRYRSVLELREDLERLLRHEPVHAAPPAVRYRLGLFVRRHRLAVAAGTVVLLALVGGSVAAALGMLTARQAEAVALERLWALQREVEQRGDLVQLLRDMMGSVQSEKQGREVRVVDLLDRAAAGLAPIEASQPERALALHGTLGAAWQDLGALDKARGHYLRGLELAAQLAREHGLEALALHNNLGQLLGRTGDLDGAEQHLRAAVAGRARALGADHVETAVARANLAMVLRRRGTLAAAEQELRAALTTLAAAGPAGERHALQTRALLATLIAATGPERLAEAEALAESARAEAVARLGAEHPVSSNAHSGLAQIQTARGRHAEAAATFRAALAVEVRVFGAEHERVFTLRNNLAAALQSAGDLAAAEAELLVVVEQCAAMERTDPARAVTARGNLAAVQEKLGRFDQALAGYDTALARAQTALPKAHYLQGVLHRGRGACLTALGRLDEAEPELTLALRILERSRPADDRFRRRALECLAELRARQGRAADAADLRAQLAAPASRPAESGPVR